MKIAALALALASTAFGQSLTEVLSSNPDLSNLTNLIQPYAGQFSNLTNITLLAPNNAAISEFLGTPTGGALASNQNLVQAILSYHVLQGNLSNITNTSFIPTNLQPPTYANVTGGQRVYALPSGGNVTFFSGLLQNSSVVNTTQFSGGTIHIIDRFLTIPQNVSTTAVALNLTSAVGAIEALNLTNTVSDTADVTLFLPNNAAFQRIGGNLQNLSSSELTNILSYHVVAGQVLYSTNITNGSSVASFAKGSNLTFTMEGSSVYVNNAEVIQPNVLIANGVIHVIDRVLNPGNSTAAPNTSMTEEAFPSATSATDVPYTSGVPTPTSAIPTDAVSSAEASASGSGSSSGGAFRPLETGVMGMAALFGGAAAVMNM